MRELVSGEIEFVSGGLVQKMGWPYSSNGSGGSSNEGYVGDGPFLPDRANNFTSGLYLSMAGGAIGGMGFGPAGIVIGAIAAGEIWTAGWIITHSPR